MSFPSSDIGLPSQLKYELPFSLPDSARSYSVNVAPDGITQVSAPFPTAPYVLANAAPTMGNFTSQQISFTIPSGTSLSTFMDTNSTTLSFTLTYNITTAQANGVAAVTNLIGSAASFFDNLSVYSNNIPLETINQYGLLQNFLLANTVNIAERNSLSISMGCDSNSNTGIELDFSSTGIKRYSFTIPLLSIIGCNNVDKFIPIGSINNLQLFMTTANLLPFASYSTTVPTTVPAATGGIQLTEFQLNMKYIDVGDQAAALLSQTLRDGKWLMKCITYGQSSVSLPAGSQGTQQLLLQLRYTSVKSVIHQFGTAGSAICPSAYYDAINPALTTRQLQIGGNFFPNRPLNDCFRGSEAYTYLIQALNGGGSLIKSYGTSITRDSYNSVLSAVSGADSSLVVPGATTAGNRAAAGGSDIGTQILIKYPSSAYMGYDVEKCAGILFTGINSRSSPPFLNLYLQNATTPVVLMNAWAIVDCVLEIDVPSKSIVAYV